MKPMTFEKAKSLVTQEYFKLEKCWSKSLQQIFYIKFPKKKIIKSLQKSTITISIHFPKAQKFTHPFYGIWETENSPKMAEQRANKTSRCSISSVLFRAHSPLSSASAFNPCFVRSGLSASFPKSDSLCTLTDASFNPMQLLFLLLFTPYTIVGKCLNYLEPVKKEYWILDDIPGESPDFCPQHPVYGKEPEEDCAQASDPNELPKSPLEKWFTKQMFEDLFPKSNIGMGPHPCLPYSYESFIMAARYFPEFGAAHPNKQFKADEHHKRDVATFFAHALQETGENDASVYKWVIKILVEDPGFVVFFSWFILPNSEETELRPFQRNALSFI